MAALTSSSTPQLYTQYSPQVTHKGVFPSILAFQSAETSTIPIFTDRARITPVQGNVTFDPMTPQNRIQFKLDRLLYDHRELEFEADVVCTGPGGGVTQWLSFDARTMFKRIRVLATNNPVEEERNANEVLAILTETKSDIGATVAIGSSYGAEEKATRQANALITKKYMMPVRINLFARGPFPATLMLEEMVIEFELAPPNECMESSAAFNGQTYQLSNCQLHTTIIESVQYLQTMRVWTQMGGLDFGYKTMELVETAPQTTANQTVQLPQRNDSVDAILVRLMPEGFDRDIQNLDKFITWPRLGIDTAQIKVFGRIWPREAFQLADVQAVRMYQEVGHLLGWKIQPVQLDTPRLTWDDYNTGDRFLLLFDLSHLLPDGLISRTSSASQVVDPTITTTYTAPPASMVLKCYFIIYRTCILGPDFRWRRATQ